MAGLPPVPAGANPFIVYDNWIKALVQPTPSAGFEVRMWIVFAILIWVGVISVTAFVLHCIAQRRLGRKVWLVRVMQRDGGSFIVGNHLALVALAGLTLSAISAGAVYTHLRFYGYKEERHSISDWRLAIWAPSFVAGWSMSWSSLHSYLHVVGDKTPSWMLRGGIFSFLNVLSVGLGTLLTAALLVLSVIGAVTGHRVSDRFDELHRFLKTSARVWQPDVTDSATTAQLNQLFASYFDSISIYYDTFEILLAIYAVTIIFICLVASGTVALVFILRRQIRMSVEDLQATTMRIEELDPTSPSLSGRERSRGWRSQVRKAARGGEVEGIGSEQAKRIEGLRKVEQERIIICGVMFTFSILIFTLIIYTLVTLRQLGANNWPRTEFALTFSFWLFSVVIAAGATAHAILEFRHLPPRRAPSSFISTSGPKPTPLNSLSQHVHISVLVTSHVSEDESHGDGKDRPRGRGERQLRTKESRLIRSVSFGGDDSDGD